MSRSRAVMVSQVHLNCSKSLYCHIVSKKKKNRRTKITFLSQFLSSIYLFLLSIGSISFMEFGKLWVAGNLISQKVKRKGQRDRT